MSLRTYLYISLCMPICMLLWMPICMSCAMSFGSAAQKKPESEEGTTGNDRECQGTTGYDRE